MNSSMFISLEIVEAQNLKAGDIGGSSDPYVILKTGKGVINGLKTPVMKNTLNPVWNYQGTVNVNYNFSFLRFEIYDYDAMSKDDLLGTCTVKSNVFNDGVPYDSWESIIGENGKEYGLLHLRMEPHNLCNFCDANQAFSIGNCAASASSCCLTPFNSDQISSDFYSQGKLTVGLGWDFTDGHSIDLDASVLCFDKHLSSVDSIYYLHRINSNSSIVHSGDNRSGDKEGDDESIVIDLDKVPKKISVLACIVTSYNPTVSLKNVDCAYVRLFNQTTTLCSYTMSNMIDDVGLFFCYFIRQPNKIWLFQTLGVPLSNSIPTKNEIDCTFHLKQSQLYQTFYPNITVFLHIEIVEARNLKSADLNGFSDPYVIIKGTKTKTNIVKKTLNPTWNFSTELPISSFEKLTFQIYDWDRFSTDDLIGEVSLDYFGYRQAIDSWFPVFLKKHKVKTQYGELHLRLNPTIYPQ